MLAHAQENEKQIGVVTNTLKAVIHLMCLPSSFWIIISNYPVILQSAYRSSALLKTMKDHAKVCNNSTGHCGKDPQECLNNALSYATIIRDLAVEANERAQGLKSIPFITMLTEKTAVGWDDFVVDLTLSSDTEMNDSIALLADAV